MTASGIIVERRTKAKVENALIEFEIDACEFSELLNITGWKAEEAIDNINSFISGSVATVYLKNDIVNGIKNAGLYDKLSNNLSNINTMRGGTKGFKGFVFEELHATEATLQGSVTEVINNNNGVSDFIIKNADGSIMHAQAKAGYHNQNIDFSAYKGQTIIVDKGNQELINKAKNAGLKVIESDVSLKQSTNLANSMQLETKITGSKNAILVPKTHSTINIAKEAHYVGKNCAVKGAQFGGGFSLGTNIVDVVSGDKDADEAVIDIVKDSAVSAGVGYVTGMAITAIGNTAVGSAITTAGTAIASTTVGGSVIAAGTAAVGTATAVGTAVTGTVAAGGAAIAGAVASAGTAIAGTAVGGGLVTAGSAVAGTMAAAGTAIASTAVGGAAVAAGTAVAGAAIVAAPVVAVGAVLGVGYKVVKKIFRR